MDWKNYVSDVIKAAGITQVKLATELGCGQATIADILNGKTINPRSNLAFALISFGRRHGLEDPLMHGA